MANVINEIKVRGCKITIAYDECAEDPRTFSEHLGKMHLEVNGHLHLIEITDEETFNDVNLLRYKEADINPNLIAFPVYAYIHSGIALRLTEFYDKWDSGCAGYIVFDKKEVRDEFQLNNDEELREKCFELAKLEVEEYNQYINGEVYEVTVRNTKTRKETSMGNFYGDIHKSDIIDLLAEVGISSEIQDTLPEILPMC